MRRVGHSKRAGKSKRMSGRKVHQGTEPSGDGSHTPSVCQGARALCMDCAPGPLSLLSLPLALNDSDRAAYGLEGVVCHGTGAGGPAACRLWGGPDAFVDHDGGYVVRTLPVDL
eukprot:1099656-Rhodomonas_salina.3